jgi:hypothetical protein
MAQPQNNTTVAAPAAAIRVGYKVGYEIDADGKKILSRGEVFSVRRTGTEEIEITLLHAKTGALFVNKLAANAPVALLDITFNPETGGPLAKEMAKHLAGVLKENVSEFFAIMPIED